MDGTLTLRGFTCLFAAYAMGFWCFPKAITKHYGRESTDTLMVRAFAGGCAGVAGMGYVALTQAPKGLHASFVKGMLPAMGVCATNAAINCDNFKNKALTI